MATRPKLFDTKKFVDVRSQPHYQGTYRNHPPINAHYSRKKSHLSKESAYQSLTSTLTPENINRTPPKIKYRKATNDGTLTTRLTINVILGQRRLKSSARNRRVRTCHGFLEYPEKSLKFVMKEARWQKKKVFEFPRDRILA